MRQTILHGGAHCTIDQGREIVLCTTVFSFETHKFGIINLKCHNLVSFLFFFICQSILINDEIKYNTYNGTITLKKTAKDGTLA